MSDLRVLLIDDEVDFLDALAERLRMKGFVVVAADGGEAALEAVEAQTFDAIVLDMAMPGMDGIETLERLLEGNRIRQVILLTGRATLEQAATAIRLGALDLLEKPADLETLVKKIELAATKRWALEEQRIEEKVSDIIRKKGW
jgi:DNA-binding NtrC family response regulator